MSARLTTLELVAVMHAVTAATAGDLDDFGEAEAAALKRAEDKVRAMLDARPARERVAAEVAAREVVR